MIEKTIYIADDNSRFDDKNDCIHYEHICAEVDAAMSLLKPRPNEGCDFENGSGYLQQHIQTCELVRKQILNICALEFPYWERIIKECGYGLRHISHASRIIYDYDYRCLVSALNRLECIDFTNGKEFGQPYFVSHQDEVINEI
jgi:hypothetical protein